MSKDVPHVKVTLWYFMICWICAVRCVLYAYIHVYPVCVCVCVCVRVCVLQATGVWRLTVTRGRGRLSAPVPLRAGVRAPRWEREARSFARRAPDTFTTHSAELCTLWDASHRKHSPGPRGVAADKNLKCADWGVHKPAGLAHPYTEGARETGRGRERQGEVERDRER